jgi:EAL and modified HD-GYP domain-containing signal transduction protein
MQSAVIKDDSMRAAALQNGLGSSQALSVATPNGPIRLIGGTRYLARQPILDLRGQIHGYELLYRNGPEAAFRGDGDLASCTMLDNTVLFGLEMFTGRSLAFINCTSRMLTENLVSILPQSATTLEILETVEPTPDLADACRKLKALGFRLALDDFVWAPSFVPFVELADYIKVDFMLTDAAGRKDLIRKLKGKKVSLLAEKVETKEEYEQACLEGFTLFQGYYFCRPELVKNRKIPSNQLCHFDILRLLQADPVDISKLSNAVKRDESLTYRILRMVNSVGYAIRQEIDSVRSALRILGEDAFRRIIVLAIAAEFNTGRPPEILRMAMIRARFCEVASELLSLCSTEQYLLGMFSLLPAMLGSPMDELTPALPVRREIREALEGQVNPEGRLLGWLKGHECGDWAACDSIIRSCELDQERLSEIYIEAVLGANSEFTAAA